MMNKLSIPHELLDIHVRYEALPKVPLRITAHMATPIIHYEALHFDGILAYEVARKATNGIFWPRNILYLVPLPLEMLWVAETGAPLWASTNLEPHRTVIESVVYYHKRELESYQSNTERIETKSGMFKAMRRPFPSLRCDRFSTDVIGNAEAISSLLSNVHEVGKKRRVGQGAIIEWQIDPIDTFQLTDEDGKYRRPVPAAYEGKPARLRGGFTPPYYESSLWEYLA